MSANTINRTGMTLDPTGRQGAFPPWPHSDASPTAWVGQLGAARARILAIAQARHEQNQQVILSRAAGKQVVLPEPDVRQAIARKQQRDLRQIDDQIDAVAAEAAAARAKLKPYDHSQDSFAAVMGRQELRRHLLGMKPEQREAAMRRPAFRVAALEAEPELSGLPAALHRRLYEEDLHAKYPAEVEGADEAIEAAALVRETSKVARLAVEAELLAAGTTVAEPAEAGPSVKWI